MLEQIKNAFTQIKNAIREQGVEVSDTDSPTTYSDKIRQIRGDDSLSKTFMIYLDMAGLKVTPGKPTGGQWDSENDQIIGTITSVLSNGETATWSTTNNHTDGTYQYVAIGTFGEDGELIGTWSDPVCIGLVKEVEKPRDGINGVSMIDTTYWYKSCNDSEGVEAPATTDNPENDGWTTISSEATLDVDHHYLWCFIRTTYSNGNITQTEPYIVRYYNDQVVIDYNEIREELDIDDIVDRIGTVEQSVDDIEGTIETTVNQAVEESIGEARTKWTADAITSAVTKANAKWKLTYNNPAEGEDPIVYRQYLKASGNNDYYKENWYKNSFIVEFISCVVDNGQWLLTYINSQGEEVSETKNKSEENFWDESWYKQNNRDTAADSYEVTADVTEMSAIQQKSDQILMAVGDGTEVAASIQILAHDIGASGSKIILDASNVEINGGLTAGSVKSNMIDAGAITADKIAANAISADKINADALVARQVQTESAEGIKTTIVDGLFTITDTDNKVRAQFGLDNSGNMVLNFYDSDGELTYSFGSNGAVDHSTIYVTDTQPTWTPIILAKVAEYSDYSNNTGNSQIWSPPNNSDGSTWLYPSFTTYYLYQDGVIVTTDPETDNTIYKYYSGSDSSSATTSHTAYHNNLFSANSQPSSTTDPSTLGIPVSGTFIEHATWFNDNRITTTTNKKIVYDRTGPISGIGWYFFKFNIRTYFLGTLKATPEPLLLRRTDGTSEATYGSTEPVTGTSVITRVRDISLMNSEATGYRPGNDSSGSSGSNSGSGSSGEGQEIGGGHSDPGSGSGGLSDDSELGQH